MKQTKPYGRAFIPASETKASEEQKTPKNEDAEPAQKQATPISVELFDLGGSHISKQTVENTPSIQKTIQSAVTVFGGVIVLLAAFIGMRDSMLLSNILDVMPTEETVMVCKDGKMVYKDDFSIMERLLNEGNFVCTDWHVQRGFLTIPRFRG